MSRADITGIEGRAVLWDYVGKTVFSGDLSVGNLEFAVNPDWIIEKMLRYSLRPEQAEPFLGDPRFGTFDVLSLANNHLNDALSGGIVSTCRYLDEKGITHVGANRTPEEQDQFPIVEKNGIKVAFLAYSFTTNNIPLEPDFGHGINVVRFNALRDEDYDPSLIHKHIDMARERGADLIVACNHWGVEFEYYPPYRLVNRAHDLMDRGIDIIIGHHPHILNPSEWYQAKDGRNCLCLYSLGNLTNHSMLRPETAMSQIVNIGIEKGVDTDGAERTYITDAEIRPTYFLGSFWIKKRVPRLLPLLKTVAEIEKGRPPANLNREESTLLKRMAREHHRWFRQDQAFSYR
jgi:poly-gamma-glutamate synthesis protein (capsule biosynthesis protein)